ncbi:MAG TPA: tetratricopeptide repeat protein, partial [Nitrospira sp.]|nr:tetratricopeptide repeat protein [Nitrospira sp.]
MRSNKKLSLKSDKSQTTRGHKRGVVGYSRKTALLEQAITQMNAGKYGRSSAALKELLALDPHNMEARRLFATLHLRLGSLIPARQAFDSLISEAFQRQDYWLAESLLREYLAAGPRCVPFLEKLGALYQEKGNALEAVGEYGKAIDILIEDPEPDNPHHAAQLYAKIRELAPASPVAFRLASSFDTQTGELLTRQSGDSGQSTIAPSPDLSEGDQSIQAGSKPMDGVMPWEIQDFQATAPETFKVADVSDSDVSDSSGSLIPPTITDLPAPQGPTRDGDWVPSDPPLREQTADDASEVRNDVPATESSEAQHGPDPAVPTGGPAAVQEQDRLSAEAEPEAPYDLDVSGSPTVSTPIESADASEPPTSSAQSIEAAGVTPSSQIEEISASTYLDTEPPTAGPIEVEDAQPSIHKSVETASKEVITEPPPDVRAPSSPESVSANEISEPWKQPGFSWESVFNSAWKFGSDHSANPSLPVVTQTDVDEVHTPASAEPPLRELALESRAVEIPEREAPTSLGEQTPSGFPIAPMPWDQIQESVISILPSQTDQPAAERAGSTVDRSAGEVESLSEVSDDQAQPPIFRVSPAAEMETFSIAPALQTPVSPEPEIPAADVKPVSIQTESDFTFVKPEQPPPASSLTMDEPPALVVPIAAIASPIFESESLTDDRVVPTSETLSKETEDIPISPPLPERQRIRELPPEIATTPHLAEEPTEAQTHERQPQASASVEKRTPIPESIPEPVPEQEEWGKVGESIRFITPQTSPIAHVPPSISERQEVSRSMSVAAAAVDVLFESSRNVKAPETRGSIAEPKPHRESSTTLSRIRVAMVGFVGSCFSTTHAIVATCVGLVMLLGIFTAFAIGAIGLTWIIMEESPSPAFQSFTTTPQRTLSDFKKNGYFLLLGIDASVGRDPIQEGYDRKPETNDGNSASACFGGSGSRTIKRSNASADVMHGWVRSSDPVGEFKMHQETIKGWGNQHQLALNRYGRWQKLPFEDWGYGQPVGPPCTAMIFAHQLHVADGFLQ